MLDLDYPDPGSSIILVGRYKILNILYAGEHSVIYEARDLNFPDVQRFVAVKEMSNPLSDRALHVSVVNKFQWEVNKIASLTYPSVPKIYDFFDLQDRIYLVMEYIEGFNLEHIMEKDPGKLSISQITEWAIALCDVLGYLHSRPKLYIFRAMKPPHIMVSKGGGLYLIDFDVLRKVTGDQPHGIDRYAAPECIEGNFTLLTDIYSLGTTLHHLMTLQNPLLKSSFGLYKRPMRDFNPQVSPELERIIMKALAFDPAERWQSAAEMKAALEALPY
jgi:eukaryotic-like serine/threonine-protein kinase